MSREEFKNFIKSSENNILLKEQIVQCQTSKDLILLARQYGLFITLEDLNYDRTATKIEFWFKKSKINPLKYIK